MPALTPPSHASPGGAADPEATLEAESAFARFRQALPDVAYHDVAIHDAQGEMLWRDHPDSQVDFAQILSDARDALGLGIRYPCLELPLDDKYATIVLPVWSPDGTLAAMATLVIPMKVPERRAEPSARFLTAGVSAALRAMGSTLSGLDWSDPVGESTQSTSDQPQWRPPLSEESAREAPAAVPQYVPQPVPQQVQPPAPAKPAPAQLTKEKSAEHDRALATIRDEGLELHVQPLARLRSSARTRRYEVLLRSRSEGDAAAPQSLLRTAREHGLDSMLDRRVISQLMAWLVKNRAQWKGDIPMFSVNLSVMAISESHFFKFVDLCVRKADLPRGLIGFEITEKACREKPECALRAIETFRGLGCPVVIDDFTMHSDVMPLLAQAGIRLVKIDPQLTIGALGDRMREARVVAIVQAMRVLGMQTVAKRVEDEAEREWLTALGVDFVQSFRFMPPEPLEDWGKKK
jgi:EAL domain-containing protein (putative c-di-GMP-specific phosphodiesterase class I)